MQLYYIKFERPFCLPVHVVMENFRKFSHVETFRKVSRNVPNDVCAPFLTCLFFLPVIYVVGYFTVLSMFRETFRKFSSLGTL
jgi:hypothetical protein